MALSSINSEEWTCQRCTYINSGVRRKCEICFARKQAGDVETSGTLCQASNPYSSTVREWTCRKCTYVNPGIRRKCEMCFGRKQTSEFELESSPSETKDQFGGGEHASCNRTVKEDEIRIVLIGKTGSGKSASGNTLLGKYEFESEASGVSLTQKCSYKTAERFGKNLMVVDTPGLFDTGMSNEQVTKEIVKCVGISSPGPHAFVLVVPVGRFTQEEQDTVQYFSEVFGEEIYNHMVVLFTRRDDIERQNIDIHEYIPRKAPNELQSLVQKCSGQVLAINNVQERDMRDKDAEIFINLVDEVTKKNGGSFYTNEMFREAEDQLVKRIQEVKEQIDIEKDIEKRLIKKELYFEYQNKIKNVQKQKREAERKEREYRKRVRELETKRARGIGLDRNDRFRIEREQERVRKEYDEMKRRMWETEEQEAAIRREKMEKEDSAFKTLEIKHRMNDNHLRKKERKNIVNEDEEVFSKLWGGMRNGGKGFRKGFRN